LLSLFATHLDASPIHIPYTSIGIRTTADLMPRIPSVNSCVATVHDPAMHMLFADNNLILDLCGFGSPLEWLGRLIDPSGRSNDLRTQRFVEPGVGRTYLVDRVGIHSRPDLVDFTVSGVGPTQYCTTGFPDVGSPLDGFCSLDKILHRHHVAEVLELEGCRVPRTAAIIALPDLRKRTVQGEDVAAGLLVRGSKTAFRVQQFDPLHGFAHSDWCSPNVEATLVHRVPSGVEAEDVLATAAHHWHIRSLARAYRFRFMKDAPERAGIEIRWAVVAAYARCALATLCARLACDGVEILTPAQYVEWFAREIGRQLAVFGRIGFLFDYRVCRNLGYASTFNEGQISVLAEFHDLETALLVWEPRSAGVYATDSELLALRDNFRTLHSLDVKQASEVVETTATIVQPDDEYATPRALQSFYDAYNA